MTAEIISEGHTPLCHEFHDLATARVMDCMRMPVSCFLALSGIMTPLAKAIQESGKKDADLARHLDVPRQYVGRWKKGKGVQGGDDFPREYAEKAAQFLGVSAASLLGLPDSIPAAPPDDEIAAAFARALPDLSEERRKRLYADLIDAAQIEGLEGFAPASRETIEKKGE